MAICRKPSATCSGVRSSPGGGRDLAREGREPITHASGIQRLVTVLAEYVREKRWIELAEHHVAVGHRERTAAPITRRPRIRARGVRSHPVTAAVEVQNGSTAGGDRVDAHHRRTHANAGNLGLEGALVLARVVRHVGRRAAHVETDDAIDAETGGGAHRTDDPAGRPREDAVLALEHPCIHQPAVGLHEHQSRVLQIRRDPIHVAAQDGRQIRVHDGSVAAPDELHQGADLVGDRDLCESDLPRDVGDHRLVIVVSVAVDERDGARADAFRVGLGQRAARAARVQRLELDPVGPVPASDLDDALVEQLRQLDVQLEQVRPGLVADAQRVGESPGHQQDDTLALALEQRVGRNRGAHLHAQHLLGRDGGVRRDPHQIPDPLQGRVRVTLRRLRQQLMGVIAALGVPCDHVRERAATIDPELPLRHRATLAENRREPHYTDEAFPRQGGRSARDPRVATSILDGVVTIVERFTR